MKTMTAHCDIGLFQTNHYQQFFELVDNNRNRLGNFFTTTLKKTESLASTKAYCEEITQKTVEKSFFVFAITSLESNDMVGYIDVKNIDWPNSEAEVGYFADSCIEGTGTMHRGLIHVLNWLATETDLQTAFCRIHESNTRSVKLAERAGFSFKEVLVNSYLQPDGITVDLCKYTKSLR